MKPTIFFGLTALLLLVYGCNSQPSARYTNQLIHESSPYLLQHAHNPVNWYPWGPEALEKAKKEDKLLIISIGYSACHWCHVMEKESFEDTTVARIMNEHFVAIKVDREERPDVDDIYMTACQLATERGCGWPLNAFALPDGRPVWAGTYFPKKEWLKVLEYFMEVQQKEAGQMERYANELTEMVGALSRSPEGEAQQPSESQLQNAVDAMLQQMDPRRGGRKGSPKFPMPVSLELLLQYYQTSKDPAALEAVETTLLHMAQGGIYDQLAGGFARYATDAQWKIPHFEKMLYDNGQLISVYAHAYQLTKEPLYQAVIEQTLAFIDREMSGPEGGFYSSFDADSEGEEGKFYVWTKAEIDSFIQDPKLAALLVEYYGLSKNGNWEDGKNILHHDPQNFVDFAKYGWSDKDGQTALKEAHRLLLQARNQRQPPGLDQKRLTAWNALMLNGFLDAYRALGAKKYLEKALQNARFLEAQMLQPDGSLRRNFMKEQAVIPAFLDDYALAAQAFMALYEATFDQHWLELARQLTDFALIHFQDETNPLLFYTSDLSPPLVVRRKEVSDNVLPASNSAFARVLLALGHYYYDKSYQTRAEAMLQAMLPEMTEAEQPHFYANWWRLYQELLQPPYEVAIVGPEAINLQQELLQTFLPQAHLLGGTTEGDLELLKGKLVPGKTLIYVCQNKVCRFPVQTVQQALALMK